MSGLIGKVSVLPPGSWRWLRMTLASSLIRRPSRRPRSAARGRRAAGFDSRKASSWSVLCSVVRSRFWHCRWRAGNGDSRGCSAPAAAVRRDGCLWSGVQQSRWCARRSRSAPASGWPLSCSGRQSRRDGGVVEVTTNDAANVATCWPASKPSLASSGSAPIRARRPNPPQANRAVKPHACWRSARVAAASAVPAPTGGCNRIRWSPRKCRGSPPLGEWPKNTALRWPSCSPRPEPTSSAVSAFEIAPRLPSPVPEHPPPSWLACRW